MEFKLAFILVLVRYSIDVICFSLYMYTFFYKKVFRSFLISKWENFQKKTIVAQKSLAQGLAWGWRMSKNTKFGWGQQIFTYSISLSWRGELLLGEVSWERFAPLSIKNKSTIKVAQRSRETVFSFWIVSYFTICLPKKEIYEVYTL